jgi:hypothetical protein
MQYHTTSDDGSTSLGAIRIQHGCCIKALPRHIQRLVGDIPTLRTPSGWDPTIPVNIIIATDGYETLGVGYHSWIVVTEDEDILLQGGGPDDGDLFIMQSY